MQFFKLHLNKKIFKLIKKCEFKTPILEVGCGTGETLQYLIKKGIDIQGIDVSKKAITICKSKGLNVKKKNILNDVKKYNSILCIDVIEHIKDDCKFIDKLYHSLHKGGKLFVFVPSGKFMDDDIKYGHYRRYSKNRIVNNLKKSGFSIKIVEMYGFPFFYFGRYFMNWFGSIKTNNTDNILKNTHESSYKIIFEKKVVLNIISVLEKSILYPFFLIQELFKYGKKGFAVVVISIKE